MSTLLMASTEQGDSRFTHQRSRPTRGSPSLCREPRSLLTPAGGTPTSALSFDVPIRVASVIALRSVATNSSSRPGSARRPRSPPAQSPAAGSNTTIASWRSSSVVARRSSSSSCGNSISTCVNPAAEAASKRSYGSRSCHSMLRFAANRGTISRCPVAGQARSTGDPRTSRALTCPRRTIRVLSPRGSTARRARR